MSKTTVELGDRVRDRVSKFEGIATGRHQFLHGCLQFSVSSEDKKASDKEERVRSFDEPSLEIVKKAVHKQLEPQGPARQPSGGPAAYVPSISR